MTLAQLGVRRRRLIESLREIYPAQYFASPRSSKSTGNILNVDGGVVASYTR